MRIYRVPLSRILKDRNKTENFKNVKNNTEFNDQCNKKEGNKQMKQWKQPLAFIGYVEGYDSKNKGSY